MWFYHCISHHRTSFYFLSNNALGFTLSEFTISDPANYVNAFMHCLHGLVSQQVYLAWIGFCLLIFAQKQVGCFRLTEVYASLTRNKLLGKLCKKYSLLQYPPQAIRDYYTRWSSSFYDILSEPLWIQ